MIQNSCPESICMTKQLTLMTTRRSAQQEQQSSSFVVRNYFTSSIIPLCVLAMIGVIVHSFVITRANSSVEYESWIPLISATISREHLHQQQPDEKRLKIPLEQLTKFNITVSCPDGLVAMQDRHIPENSLYGATTSNRLIPRIVHQTSKSRCITQPMADIAKHWSIQDDDGTNWSYYFHDDNAMQRLFDQPWPEFPHIHDVLACIKTGTMRADLWRYLVLYEYGGIYADLDTKPAKFNASMINPTTDGFFVVEMYHIPSQWFMATSPRHPIMYYSIQYALSNILNSMDISKMYAASITGPRALLDGYATFRADAGDIVPRSIKGNKCVKAGLYNGTDGRSITVVGIGERESEYIIREAIRRESKIQEYSQMGMKHFTKERVGVDGSSGSKICLSHMFHERLKRERVL